MSFDLHRALSAIAALLTATLFIVAYLVLFWFVRWRNIVVPLREFTHAQVKQVRRRFRHLLEDSPNPCPEQEDKPPASPRSLGDEACLLLQQAETAVRQSGWQALLDPFFWPRGSELKAWRLLHEAEEWLIPGFALL